MIFFINAWLDRPSPFVSVHNRETGKEVVRFEHQELETHLAEGSLSVQDFCSANSQQLQSLIKELLLLRCSYMISKGSTDSSSEDKLTSKNNILLFQPTFRGSPLSFDELRFRTSNQRFYQKT